MFDLIPAKMQKMDQQGLSMTVSFCDIVQLIVRDLQVCMGWHGTQRDSKHDKHAIFVIKKGGDSRPKKHQKTIFAMSQELAFTFSYVCEQCGHSPSLHGKKLVISLRQTLEQPCVTEGFAQDKVLMTGSQLKHCKTCILRNTPVCFKPPKPGAPPKLNH